LHDLRPEALVYVEATSWDETQSRRVEHYLMELKGAKPHLTGKDLARLGLPPGPHFGRMLHALQVAKLDGRVPSKHDEERFLLEQIEKWKST
jgi:tRNA nucleotidyltransferase (CCA-adding enzyme)